MRNHPSRPGRLLLFYLALLALLAACQSQPQVLRLATTTSTEDSGLLPAILPDFEQQARASVEVVAVGTGQALALGAAGDVDVVLVHARQREEEFVAAGHGLERLDVMVNDFVLLGPPSDPAGVAQSDDVAAALSQIAAAELPFISRGDDSGTHIREMALWQAAGVDPAGAWYRSVGQGMGQTLTLANEQEAYTLSDRGTYISRQGEGFNLEVMVEGDNRLLNPYSVIAVNPERHPSVNGALAAAFVEWLISPETQARIAAYRVNDQQLFFPNAGGACPPGCSSPAAAPAYEPASQASPIFLAALRQAVALIFSGDSSLWRVVGLSLYVSATALFLAAIVGVPLGAWLGLRRFRGQHWLSATIYTGMGFPPVVIGLIIYLLLSRGGVLGGLGWLFTPRAMIAAQTILALPLIVGVTMTAVRGVSANLWPQLRSLGATDRQILATILGEARFGVIVGLMAGFGAAISEVGAVMLVGGNIEGQTRVLTTAIVLETRRGNFELALALGILLLLLAFIANALAVRFQIGRSS